MKNLMLLCALFTMHLSASAQTAHLSQILEYGIPTVKIQIDGQDAEIDSLIIVTRGEIAGKQAYDATELNDIYVAKARTSEGKVNINSKFYYQGKEILSLSGCETEGYNYDYKNKAAVYTLTNGQIISVPHPEDHDHDGVDLIWYSFELHDEMCDYTDVARD